MAAASEPRAWYLILQSTLLALFGQLLRTARKAFRRKTMTNVKKERGSLEFKRVLSDRPVRSKADIYQVFIIAMLREVNRRKQSRRVDVYSIIKHTYIFNTHICINTHTHMYVYIVLQKPAAHSTSHHHPFCFSLGC